MSPSNNPSQASGDTAVVPDLPRPPRPALRRARVGVPVKPFVYGLLLMFGASLLLDRVAPAIVLVERGPLPFYAGCALFCLYVLARIVRAGSPRALLQDGGDDPVHPGGYLALLLFAVFGAWVWGRAVDGTVELARHWSARTPDTLVATYKGPGQRAVKGGCRAPVALATELGTLQFCASAGKGKALWADVSESVRAGDKVRLMGTRNPYLFAVEGVIYTGRAR